MRWLGLLLVCATVAAAAPGRDTLQITGTTPLVVAAGQPTGVQMAADDLAGDMAEVFGARPPVLHALPAAGTPAIVIGDMPGLPSLSTAGAAPESFAMAVQHTGHSRAPVLHLQGADMRGTIYAVYQFSQQMLGTDPMAFWTGKEPARREAVAVPLRFTQSFPAPVFRYRGFFINDEDLLSGWAPGPPGEGTGISLAVWNKVFETVLRLKGNLIVPGTWIFPNEPSEQLASRRGLILNQHHAEPLGVNAARWPRGVPYNYSTHPEILEAAWRNAVAAVPLGTETLWTVGLRGLSDQSYAALDPAARDDKVLGALIGKAIAKQMEIVRARFPEAHFITNLWMEGAQLRTRGLLTIPKEVITVWPDTGYGYLQDHGTVEAGSGAYFHVAMMNNEANQLTEMVPVERILAEQQRLQRAGATSVFLVNTSDIRPVAMTARATMQYAWSGAAKADASTYLQQWAAEEFGDAAAPAVAEVYRQYFNAPAHQPAEAHRGEEPRTYGEQIYHTEAREMMLGAMLDFPLAVIPDQAPKWTPPRVTNSGRLEEALTLAKRESVACADAAPRWDAVWQAAEAARGQVRPERRNFYQAQVLTMIAINRESNQMLLQLSRAVLALQGGRRDEALSDAQLAADALDRILQEEKLAEYGPWKNWYHGDWLTGIPRTRELTGTFLAFLRDPGTPVPPPIVWNDWEAYFHIMRYEGDRTVDVH